MNQFILDDAISCLDSDLLATHLKLKEKYRNRKANRVRRIVRWSALAACFCLLLVSSIIILPNIDNILYGEMQSMYFEGETMKSKDAEVMLVEADYELGICTFEVNKKNNADMYFIFNGWISVNEWVGDDGLLYRDTEDYDVITPYSEYVSKNGYKVIDNVLKITVNGQEMDCIPSEAGNYTIVIDYSEMFEIMDHVEPKVSVNGKADFALDNDIYG